MVEGLRGEESITSPCRREGIAANLYYRWSKEFLEAGKKRLLGDTQREATSTEVTDLRKVNAPDLTGRGRSLNLEHETGFAGGLRPLCACRAKLGREPAKHATASAATPTLAREDGPEEDQ